MKKVLITVLIIIIIAALIVGGIMILRVRHSPEYALAMTVKDIEENGIEALEAHCTDKFAKEFKSALDYTNNGFVDSLISFFTGKDDMMSIIQEYADKIKWGVGDIEKGKKNAAAIITYDYNNGKITGDVDVDMVKEKGEWLISGIDFPELDHIGW